MLKAQLYDGTKFFRCVKDFVIQFGIPASPIKTRRWSDPIQDDPPFRGIENRRGTIVFATSGPNTRTTQLFINLVENSNSLDNKDFVPVGEVVEGMEILDGIWMDYNELPDQDRIRTDGDEYLTSHYPQMSMVRWARLEKQQLAPVLRPPTKKEMETKKEQEGSESAIQVWAATQVNKEKIKKHKGEKVLCSCGSTVARRSICSHKKTKKHAKLLEKQTTK
jgi:cyclophilin family peptidyl-prolyl cis-trans isomerase